jgi:hypothetical protein
MRKRNHKMKVRPASTAAVFRVLDGSAPYDTGGPGHREAAERIMVDVRLNLQRLIDGTPGPEDTDPYDAVCNCLATAQNRTLQIGGPGANRAMEVLNDGAQALNRTLERWKKTQRWGFDGPGLVAVRDAIDLYENILWASSPLQMESAQAIRMQQLQERRREQCL